MLKVNLTAILTILFIILIIGLTGCGRTEDKSDSARSYSASICKTNGVRIPNSSPDPVAITPTRPINSPSGSDKNANDYNQYLKKIWVVKSWDGGAYEGFSFFISKIENGKIQGRFSINQVANPDFYFYRLESSIYLGDLSGTVDNGVAECKFSDKAGNRDNVKLVFKENDKIDVTIKFTNKSKDYEDLSLDGKYSFRPYKLTDYENFIRFKAHSFEVELDSWGSVFFVSGKSDNGIVAHPVAFLTNEYGDILYAFGAPFQTGTEIKEASVKDINRDGLKDIKIITGFNEDPDIEPIEWIFLQKENGSFYNSDLEK